MSTLITEGTANSQRQYVLTTPDPIVLNTTSLTFAQVPNPSNLLVPVREKFTLSATDITNQYVDLQNASMDASLQVFAEGVFQTEAEDFTLSVVSLVTRVSFAGDLATGGNAALVSGDKLSIHYSYQAG